MPNFIEIYETFCGRTDGRTFETHFIMSTLSKSRQRGTGKFAGERPAFCRCATQLTMTRVSVSIIAGRARLRSADRYDLVTPRVRTVHFRQRSFRAAAPNA